MAKKIKIPGWALLKKNDERWVGYSQLGRLYKQDHLNHDLFTVGYYYTKIKEQYNYISEAPKLRQSSAFNLQRIVFGPCFGPSSLTISPRKAQELLKHWNYIHTCLQQFSKERHLIISVLETILQDNCLPKQSLNQWLPLFKKGLQFLSDGLDYQ